MSAAQGDVVTRAAPPLRLAAAAGAAVALGLAGCSASTARSAAARTPAPTRTATITVSSATCAADWVPQPAGEQHFAVRNTASVAMRVALVDAASGGIYAQLLSSVPNTVADLAAPVPAGSYVWRCVPMSGGAIVSATKPVAGTGAAGVRPLFAMSADEINAAVSDYREHVTTGLATLAADTDALRVAVGDGDTTAAKAAWLTAHLSYERLGAAYDTFGDLAEAIDGRPLGLPEGVKDPQWQGFLRVEYGLWNNEPISSLVIAADALDKSVHELATQFPLQVTNPADIPLRTHEILENSLQFQLSGLADEGSHTTLATARANVDGTRMVFSSVQQLLIRRDPSRVATVTRELDALASRIDALDTASGWPSVSSVTMAQREGLDAAIDELLEALAPIPDILQLPPSTAVS